MNKLKATFTDFHYKDGKYAMLVFFKSNIMNDWMPGVAFRLDKVPSKEEEIRFIEAAVIKQALYGIDIGINLTDEEKEKFLPLLDIKDDLEKIVEFLNNVLGKNNFFIEMIENGDVEIPEGWYKYLE